MVLPKDGQQQGGAGDGAGQDAAEPKDSGKKRKAEAEDRAALVGKRRQSPDPEVRHSTCAARCAFLWDLVLDMILPIANACSACSLGRKLQDRQEWW